MVVSDKVEVYLERYRDDVRYREYVAPLGTPKYTGNANERYIAVGTDERFRIVVNLLPGFRFLGQTKVRVEYYVNRGDGYIQTLSKRRSKHAPTSDRSHREGCFETVTQFINGQYMNCGLTFGELKSGESHASLNLTRAD